VVIHGIMSFILITKHAPVIKGRSLCQVPIVKVPNNVAKNYCTCRLQNLLKRCMLLPDVVGGIVNTATVGEGAGASAGAAQ
jgi:hypothetical protein